MNWSWRTGYLVLGQTNVSSMACVWGMWKKEWQWEIHRATQKVVAKSRNLWQSMAIYGNLWQSMAIYGNLWQSKNIAFFSWKNMEKVWFIDGLPTFETASGSSFWNCSRRCDADARHWAGAPAGWMSCERWPATFAGSSIFFRRTQGMTAQPEPWNTRFLACESACFDSWHHLRCFFWWVCLSWVFLDVFCLRTVQLPISPGYSLPPQPALQGLNTSQSFGTEGVFVILHKSIHPEFHPQFIVRPTISRDTPTILNHWNH